jgi:hypothetical protein
VTRVALARAFVVVVALSVGLYDTVVGLVMLFSDAPWLAHGPDTVWTHAADRLGADAALATALRASWARIGAFSLFAGVSTLAWLSRALRDPKLLRMLLIVYAVAGLGFAVSDAAWFAGTPYLTMKRVIGAAWMLALAAQFWVVRQDRPRREHPFP